MKRFLECLIPITACNLKCSYCYIIQENRRTSKQAEFQYSPKHIGKALSAERLGGTSYISICGSGETLLQKEITGIIYNILEQGHYVNVTTNGTITQRHQEIINTIPNNLLKKLHFAFSFHYLELIKTNNLDVFFNNVRQVKEAGCSFIVQINLCDEYMPHWDEIKRIVKEHTGAFPQVALTRDETKQEYEILTNKTQEEYFKIGKEMDSPLFEFTSKNFKVKRREFCYAGDWSGKLNLATGILTSCYGYGITQNIFEDLSTPIKFEPIGKNCPFAFCFNSSHFMSLGIIPSINTPTYAELRDREDGSWYSPDMKTFLSQKLRDENIEYSKNQQLYFNSKYYVLNNIKKLKNKASRLYNRLK
ncbi:radical SAM protein [Gaoshiqia sediminis]|uniref:Radical SAM protein n=1 Tax=Gaoshiqia sediminis TaxID=2986998 RepID=A0AA41Y9K1_9BACT|nr:radical SAM protein [Gaoshiqia sediminis]MCW0484121.1 radical SAM protein [Gaoshiqia sediminis]